MNEELYQELEERIDITERALYTATRNTKEYIVLENQLATMKVLRELYNWRIKTNGKKNKNPKG